MDFYDNARYEVQRRVLARALESWAKQVREMFAENIVYSRVSRWALDYANEKNVKPFRIAKEVIDYLKELMNNELEKLLSNSLIDDEQTLLLLSYMANKEEFVLYREIIDYNNLDWFYIFHYYNQA